jgi:catalase-peroxidase
MGLGWKNSFGKGNGAETISSGLEGAWTPTPTKWDNTYFKTLFKYEWKQTKSPAGATQWIPTDESAAKAVPDAHIAGKTHAPVMFTTDLAMRTDPAYEKISRKFLKDQDAFADAFARAWFKLTHRDMGPIARYLGPLVPKEQLIWQDPLPKPSKVKLSDKKIADLKKVILASGLSTSQLVVTAWASASTFRGTDKRGGANGARIALEPQRSWEVNNPKELAKVLKKLEKIQKAFNAKNKKSPVSLADLIVLGGSAAVEAAAKRAGFKASVPFKSGRTDATQQWTDVASFAVLEPTADGFRNYVEGKSPIQAEYHLVDRAALLTLTAPEMTVLVGGLRVLGANADGSDVGVFTKKKGALTNDFFVNLLSLNTTWAPKSGTELFAAHDNKSGKVKWTGSRADLVFGSNSVLRAVAEVYASDDAKEKFVKDFISAWCKVMELDRF